MAGESSIYLAADVLLLIASGGKAKSALMERLSLLSQRSSYVTSTHALFGCRMEFVRQGADFPDFFRQMLPLLADILAAELEDFRRSLEIEAVCGIGAAESLDAAICLRRGAALMSQLDSFDSVAGLDRIAP